MHSLTKIIVFLSVLAFSAGKDWKSDVGSNFIDQLNQFVTQDIDDFKE